jgi:NitT/TauT family transport system substrate-binding protein
MRNSKAFAAIIALVVATPALADDVKVGVGISDGPALLR